MGQERKTPGASTISIVEWGYLYTTAPDLQELMEMGPFQMILYCLLDLNRATDS